MSVFIQTLYGLGTADTDPKHIYSLLIGFLFWIGYILYMAKSY
jgi:hypothetical protein